MQKLLNEWRKYLAEAEFVDLPADIAGAPKDKQDFYKEKERLERKYGQDAVEVYTMFVPDDHISIVYYNPSDTSAGRRPDNQKFKDINSCKVGTSGKQECVWHFLAFPEQPKASIRGPEEPQRISRKGPVGLPQDTIKNKIKQVENEIKKLPRVAMSYIEGGIQEPVWVPHGMPTPKYVGKVLTVRQYLYLFYKYRKCLPAADKKNFLNGEKDDNDGCEGKKWQTLPYGFNVDPESDAHADKITTSFTTDNTPSAQRLKKGGMVDQRSLTILKQEYLKLKKQLKQLKSIKAADPTMLEPVDVTPINETAEGMPSFSYSRNAIDLIKHYESFRSKPYDDKCPPNKPRGKGCKGTATIGYGTTKYPNGKKVTLQDKPVTEKQAERYLIHSMGFIIQGINKFMATKEKVDKKGNPIILNQNQIDALTSAGYNVGRSRLLNSQLYTVATRDPNNPKIRVLFKTLNKPEEHKNFPGLMKRRMAEAELYFTPVESINEKKKKTKVGKAGRDRVSKKIAILTKKEKMKPKQAAAIAYSMEKAGELKKDGKHSVA